MSIVQSGERSFEWLFLIGDTMTRNPFIFAKLFYDPRNARFLFLYARECDGGIKELTNVYQSAPTERSSGMSSPAAFA